MTVFSVYETLAQLMFLLMTLLTAAALIELPAPLRQKLELTPVLDPNTTSHGLSDWDRHRLKHSVQPLLMMALTCLTLGVLTVIGQLSAQHTYITLNTEQLTHHPHATPNLQPTYVTRVDSAHYAVLTAGHGVVYLPVKQTTLHYTSRLQPPKIKVTAPQDVLARKPRLKRYQLYLNTRVLPN